MRIETSGGKEYAARAAAAARMRGESRLMIEMDVSMAEAAQAMDGLEWIKVHQDSADGAYTMYEGYNRISGLTRTENGIRVTLVRS